MKDFTFTIQGTTAMIVHNGGNISPLNPLNKLKSEYTGKRKKTDDDHVNIARIEWFQSLYLSSNFTLVLDSNEKYYASGDPLPQVILPVKCVRACVTSGAKHAKNGKALARAVQFMDADFFRPGAKGQRLQFPDINTMSDDPSYIDESVQSVQRAKVVRYRGRFEQWAATVTGCIHEDVLNPQDLEQAIAVAGKYEGINDSRSLGFGRFELIDFQVG